MLAGAFRRFDAKSAFSRGTFSLLRRIRLLLPINAFIKDIYYIIYYNALFCIYYFKPFTNFLLSQTYFTPETAVAAAINHRSTLAMTVSGKLFGRKPI